MRYLASLFFFTITLFGFDYHLKPYKVSDGVHCFFGIPDQVSHVNGGNMVNSCYVETKDGYVVIDSGATYGYAQDAYGIMAKKNHLPVKYVINTSSDEVHMLGNEFYKEQGATLIGPKHHEQYLNRDKKLHLSTILSPDAFSNTRIIPLDIYIQENTSILLVQMNYVQNTINILECTCNSISYT